MHHKRTCCQQAVGFQKMEHVKRGKLKLKGGAALKVAHDATSTRKKSKKSKKHKKASSEDTGDVRIDAAQEEVVVNDMTPAQRRHEAHRKKRVRVWMRSRVCLALDSY